MRARQQRENRDAQLGHARRGRHGRVPPVRTGASLRQQSNASRQQAERDQQQTLLLELLRRARGESVSYQELRDRGIEYPASVVSELELAGWPLERSFGCSRAGDRRLGVRLDPREAVPDDLSDTGGDAATLTIWPLRATDASARSEISSATVALAHYARRTSERLTQRGAAGAREAGHAMRSLLRTAGNLRARLREVFEEARNASAGRAVHARRSDTRTQRLRGRPGEQRARLLASAALIVVAAIVAVLAANSFQTAGHRRPASHRLPLSGRTRAARARRLPVAPPPQPAPSAPGTAVSSALAAELEARGHALLQARQFQAAILALRRAVATTGESLGACLQPSGEACLTYAYALYDLGRALRLDRQPTAAVPILEDRLRIDNQRPTVRGELELARREAGPASAPMSASG